jgi:hypothetical protein
MSIINHVDDHCPKLIDSVHESSSAMSAHGRMGTAMSEIPNSEDTAGRGKVAALVTLLVLAVGALVLLPTLNDAGEREREFTSVFTDTYDVQDATRGRMGFFVTLHNGAKVSCTNMTLEQVQAREQVKCGTTNAPLILEAK